MTVRAPDKLAKFVIDRQWGSLRRRHNGNGRTKNGPIPITKKEFAAWLIERSVGGLGVCWRCEYSGNVLTAMGKTQAAMLTVDHKIPLALGGESRLKNLAVVSEEANKIKGDLSSVERYQSLLWFLDGWPEHDRQSILKRLKGYEPIYKRRGR